MTTTDFEIGRVQQHPLKFAVWSFIGIIKTWFRARERGVPSNEWFGVYIKGTDLLKAETGCLPDAEDNAYLIAWVLRMKERGHVWVERDGATATIKLKDQ